MAASPKSVPGPPLSRVPPPRARARRGHSRAGGSRPRAALGMLRRRPGRGASELPCRPPARATYLGAPRPRMLQVWMAGTSAGRTGARAAAIGDTQGATPPPPGPGRGGHTGGLAGGLAAPGPRATSGMGGGRRPRSPGGAGAGRGRGRRRVGRSGLGGASVGVRSSLAESWGPRRGILSPAEGAHRLGDPVVRGPRGSPPPPRGGEWQIRLPIAKTAFPGPGTNSRAKPIHPVLRATGWLLC